MDGGSIVSGDLVSARIQVASDRDAWRFYGSAGQRAIVTATKTDGALDTRLAVFPPGSGAAEAQSVCDAFGCRDQLDFVLAQSGLYTITVTDENGTRRGDYNLSLILIPDTPEIGFYHLLPADGQAVAPLQTLGFSWDPVPGATSYEVYLTSDPLGPVPNVASGLLTPGFTTPVLDLDTQYFWRVEANTPGGIVRGPDRRFYAVSSTTDAPPAPTLTGEVALAPARPNPFRAGTQLTLTVPSRTAVSLRVFDLHGRLVRTLHEGPLEAGEHPFDWDGRDGRGSRVPPGLYLCSAGVGETTRLRKLCVLE
jgi:hypothetical protein